MFEALDKITKNEKEKVAEPIEAKIPPINLKFSSDWEKKLELIESACVEAENKVTKDYIKIYAKDYDQYNSIKEFIAKQKFEYYQVKPTKTN